MSHEEQLEIELSAEMEQEPQLRDVIKAPSAGRSFHLSPARSSAFSTPSRSPSRHSLGGGDDLDDDLPSAVYSSFSQSPENTVSNPTTPDRKSRISATIIISPKRDDSPRWSETETQSNPPPPPPPPEKTNSVVGSTAAGTPKKSPDRSAAVMTTPDRSSRISTADAISPKHGSSPGFSETGTQSTHTSTPDRGAEGDRNTFQTSVASLEINQSAQAGQVAVPAAPVASPSRAGVSSDATLRNQIKATVIPNHSPDREAVDQSAPVPPKTPDETSEAEAIFTPNQSPDEKAVAEPASVQPKTSEETSEAIVTVTPAESPDREAVAESARMQPMTPDEIGVASVSTPVPFGSSSEQSAPEKDTFDRSVTDPNYALHQIAAGTSSEHLTPERTHNGTPLEKSYAAVPGPPPEEDTPRVSNQEHKSMSAGDVVESVSSGMQLAFDSLRNYITVDTLSEQETSVLNTSMESGDSLTAFDIQELRDEIREVNKDEDEKKGQKEMKGGKKESPLQTSAETVHAHTPVTMSPTVPRRSSSSPTAVASRLSRSHPALTSRTRSRKERLERLNINTHSLAPATPSPPPEASKGKKAQESTPPTAPSTPASSTSSPSTPAPHPPAPHPPASRALVPITPQRVSTRSDGAMTPMMRMRNTGSPEVPVVESPPRLSDEEVKASKQRKWKDKMKLAEKNKEQERRELDGRGRRKEGDGEKEGRRRRKKSSKERRKKISKKKIPTKKKKREDDSDIGFCNDGLSKLMETVMEMQGRCGALNVINDTFSIFEEPESDEGSFDSESESEGTSTDEGESEDESETERDSNLPVWKGGTHRSRGEGVRFEPETPISVGGEDAASGSNHIAPSSPIPLRTVRRISLHEEAVEDPNDVGIHDKNFIHLFITSATTRGTDLFLHKKSRKQSFTQPSKMTAFLKLGPEQSDGTFGGPKFVWVADDGVQAGRIDLFDIRAVDKATPHQLQHYPLAMPGRSFIIKMNRSPDCVFEAMSEEAALRYVHGMRWVVARLAFNLIIGNMDVSCELLDIGRHDDNKLKTRIPPQTPVEEAQWGMAMNSLTNHLVDKASLFTTQ